MRIVIGAGFVATALRNSFSAFHHERAALLADTARRARFYGKFTVGVI
jgi:hypothetical protein